MVEKDPKKLADPADIAAQAILSDPTNPAINPSGASGRALLKSALNAAGIDAKANTTDRKLVEEIEATAQGQELMKRLGITDLSRSGTFTPSGVGLIAEERVRQILVKGYNRRHDEHHPVYHFIGAACALLGAPADHLKSPIEVARKDPDSGVFQLEDLVKAGALIAAAIDRIQNVDKDGL